MTRQMSTAINNPISTVNAAGRGRWAVLALSLGALSLGAGCMIRARPAHVGFSYQTTYTTTSNQGELYVSNPPPAMITEYQPMAPGSGYVWVSGYWDWTGYDWYWINGSWMADRPGYAWVSPRVLTVNGRWVYHRPYWNGHAHGGVRDYHYGRPANAPAGVGPRQGVSRPAAGWRGQPSGPAPAQSRPYVGQPAPAAGSPTGQGWGGIAGPANSRPAAPAPSVGAPANGGWAPGSVSGAVAGPANPRPAAPAPGVAPILQGPAPGQQAPMPSTGGRAVPNYGAAGNAFTAPAPSMPRRSVPEPTPARPGFGAIGQPSPTPTTSAPTPSTYRKMPAPTPFQRVSPSPMPATAPRQVPPASSGPTMRGTRAPSSVLNGPGRSSPQPAARPPAATGKGRRGIGGFGR